MRFEFNLDDHKFFIDGVRCWSPTAALAADSTYAHLNGHDHYARDRGKAIHKAIHDHVMEFDQVVHTGTPLAEFIFALLELQLRPLASELIVDFKVDDIPCVTIIDLLALDRHGNVLLLDIKTSKENRSSYGLQTAAGQEALRQHGIEIHERLTLHLGSTTHFTLRQRRPRDYEDFANLIRKLGKRLTSYDGLKKRSIITNQWHSR